MHVIVLIFFVALIQSVRTDSDEFVSSYNYGILDESLSEMWFDLSTSLGVKRLTLRLSKYENLETRAAMICFRELMSPCPEEVISAYRKAFIEPYVRSASELVPRTAIEGLLAGLTVNELFSINQFVNLLSPKLCDNEEATKSLKNNIKNTFSAGERLAWQNRNFHTRAHYIDIHRAYVPCLTETTWWVPGEAYSA